MKNLTKISIITLLTLSIFNCGENLIEQVKERYDNGKSKHVEYYKKIGDNQEFVRERAYFYNGQISVETNYKDGKEDGKVIWYYENGQIREKGNYKDGKRDGKWTSYYENGQIREKGNYNSGLNSRLGLKDGKWIWYNEDGSIEKVKEY